jgi:hypothetical protein
MNLLFCFIIVTAWIRMQAINACIEKFIVSTLSRHLSSRLYRDIYRLDPNPQMLTINVSIETFIVSSRNLIFYPVELRSLVFLIYYAMNLLFCFIIVTAWIRMQAINACIEKFIVSSRNLIFYPVELRSLYNYYKL